eukprot:TRINITY_DN35949_c0_g1_i1.p1 TRINITY_DN35949_c0_g1~~TRINITY_DN35949_c0_g1_i1.p1  ORF type:complete len:585 (-),score=115.45 TRINITY_DN35949_c0_g1_i1:8-1762(-)
MAEEKVVSSGLSAVYGAGVGRLEGAVSTAHGVASAVCGLCVWASGVPGRLLGKEAVALASDTARFAVAELPPVLLGRAVDVSRALLDIRLSAVLHDPKGSTARGTHAALDLLGGGFVKMAQVVAHSPALFPEPLVRACRSSLSQAGTPPASLKAVDRILVEELGAGVSDLFTDFEASPMASASIAQVHAATLRSGEKCVVKVVRPRVRERLAADFSALMLAARFVDLVLGKDLVLQLASDTLEGCVEELRQAVMAECDLALERKNVEEFDRWLRSSATLRRARLAGRVQVPRTFPGASGSRVFTMERIYGVPLSELSREQDGSKQGVLHWQSALTSALSVAALSIIDGQTVFHADLHTGNMLAVPGASGTCDSVVFIDFGCCGQLPGPLRSTLLMQASAFAGGRPDVKQFCEGFSHALQRIEGLGSSTELDVDLLAEDMKPVLAELHDLNPFRGGANPMDPRLHLELLHLQRVLCRHGVQLPREFTLLIKTSCFGALYFSILDAEHKKQLLTQLLIAGAAHAASNPKEARQLLNPAKLAILLGALRKRDRSQAASASSYLWLAAAACGLPILWQVMAYYQELPP